MPTSITPPPKDDEVECGNCGAYIYHGLLKCPNCGVYLVDPVDTEPEPEHPSYRPKSKLALWVESVMRKLRGEPQVAEEFFSGALRDTVIVPAHMPVTVAFDATHLGAWFLHCHHLYHMATGMMTEVHIA